MSLLYYTFSNMPADGTHVQVDTRTSFLGNLLKETYTVAELLAEYTEPCGRFKVPLSAVDLRELAQAIQVAHAPVFKNMVALPLSNLPPNWQVLLNYLFQQEILTRPLFSNVECPNDFPKTYRLSLRSVFSETKTDGINPRKFASGFGCSFDAQEAQSKAVGELLERYFMTLYKRKYFKYDSYNELVRQGKKVLDITDFNCFLPWQKESFPQLVWDKNSLFYWTRGKELLSGKDAYMPAQCIFWGYKFDTVLSEPILFHPSTSGNAGNFSFKEALISSVYELIERDGFLMYWLNTLAPPVLDVNAIADVKVQKLLSEIKEHGLTVLFLDTTTDMEVPSCVCVVIDERGREPVISVGASAGFNIPKNILSSAHEALVINSETAQSETFVLPVNYKPFMNTPLISRNERLSTWKGKNMLEHLSFFITGKKLRFEETRFAQYARTFATVEEEYSHLLRIFKDKGKGYEVYAHHVEHPVLQTLGYHVVGAVVPQLIPLYLSEHWATLDSKRLREVPKKLGFAQTARNPWPHPFP